MTEGSFPFSDRALSQRLERAEAEGNARFVEARAELSPEVGAEWIEVAGAYAMFDGPESPVTQTFGLGLFDPVTDAELERIEAFFRDRGAPVFHEVSPLAHPSLLSLLGERGYRPIELTSVLVRPIGPGLALAASPDGRVRVRAAEPGEEDRWSEVAAAGWAGEHPELGSFFHDIGRVTARRRGAVAYFAELDGKPIATGVLSLGDGIAILAGAATLPEARRQGAQLALLEARLRHAAEQGCDLAMMGALPGSASQRNAERHGFRIVYTRIKWRGPEPAA